MGDVLLDSTLQWNRDKPWGACVGGSSHKQTSCVTAPAHVALGGTFNFLNLWLFRPIHAKKIPGRWLKVRSH